MGRGGGTSHFDVMLMRPWLLSSSPGRKRGGSWVPGFLCSWLSLDTLTSPYSLESCFCLLSWSQSLTRNIASATSENCLSNIREGIAVNQALFWGSAEMKLPLPHSSSLDHPFYCMKLCFDITHGFGWLVASRLFTHSFDCKQAEISFRNWKCFLLFHECLKEIKLKYSAERGKDLTACQPLGAACGSFSSGRSLNSCPQLPEVFTCCKLLQTLLRAGEKKKACWNLLHMRVRYFPSLLLQSSMSRWMGFIHYCTCKYSS